MDSWRVVGVAGQRPNCLMSKSRLPLSLSTFLNPLSFWTRLNPLESIWIHLALFGSTWPYIVMSKTIGIHLVAIAFSKNIKPDLLREQKELSSWIKKIWHRSKVKMKEMKEINIHLALYGSPWHHRVLSKSTWLNFDPFGSTCFSTCIKQDHLREQTDLSSWIKDMIYVYPKYILEDTHDILFSNQDN